MGDWRAIAVGFLLGVAGCGPSVTNGNGDGGGGGDGSGAVSGEVSSDDGGSSAASTEGGGGGDTASAATEDAANGAGSTGDAVACAGNGPDCVEGRAGGACGDILYPPECDDGVWRCPVGTISPFDCVCYFLDGLLCLEGPPDDCGEMIAAVCEEGWVCPRGSTPADDCMDRGASSGGSTGDTSTTGG